MSSNLPRVFVLLSFLVTCLATPTRAVEDAWPGVEFQTVRVYLFRSDPLSPSGIIIDGNLNPTVERANNLTPAQVKLVAGTVEAIPAGPVEQMMCFESHHAVVYFDAEGKPVASAEICFHCKHTSSNPPIPDGKRWNYEKWQAIFKAAGIPAPGDPAYAKHLQKIQEKERAGKAQLVKYQQMLADAGFGNEPGSPVPPTAAAAAWPWRKFATVKLYAFPKNFYTPLVQYGNVQWPVEKEVTLTSEQRAEVWTAYREMAEEKLIGDEELRQDWLTGSYQIKNSKTGKMRPWNAAPGEACYAVVCFDEKGAAVAWLQLSFSALTYSASPPDNVLILYPGIRWSLRRLAEVFPKLGMPISEAKADGPIRVEGK